MEINPFKNKELLSRKRGLWNIAKVFAFYHDNQKTFQCVCERNFPIYIKNGCIL